MYATRCGEIITHGRWFTTLRCLEIRVTWNVAVYFRGGPHARENPIAISRYRFKHEFMSQMKCTCRSSRKISENQNCAGRGCGGRIFNYGGRFTSPLYPNTYRNNTVCTWDVSVPRGFKIILQFLVFDIGTKKNCANNNLKVYDVVPSGELLHSTYCGGVSCFIKWCTLENHR